MSSAFREATYFYICLVSFQISTKLFGSQDTKKLKPVVADLFHSVFTKPIIKILKAIEKPF